MNVFGFFAVIIACITICIIVMIVCRCGITVHHTNKDLTVKPRSVDRPVPRSLTEPKEEKQEPKEVEVTSMDAVIKAANALMGIETIEKEINNGRKE